MSEHDKFCPADTPLGGGCECEVIAVIRADEREKAAQRVEAMRSPNPLAVMLGGKPFPLFVDVDDAAAAARGVGLTSDASSSDRNAVEASVQDGTSDNPEPADSIPDNTLRPLKAALWGNATGAAFDNHSEQTAEYVNSSRQTEHAHSTCQDSASKFTTSTPSESATTAHEPECHANAIVDSDGLVIPDTYRRYLSDAVCTCVIIRAAFQRGMRRAADIAQRRHDDMLCCNKDDDCHTVARGAYLAADDIKWEIENPR